MSISSKELKKLYALSAGLCNICNKNLFENDVHIGEMAHVIARSSNGPRGESKLKYEINSYENLILLCANHHTEVDQNPNRYTVEVLLEIKLKHEKSIANKLSDSTKNDRLASILSGLFECMPFTRLLSFTESLPDYTDLELLTVSDVYQAFTTENPHIYPFSDAKLQIFFNDFIRSYYEILQLITGHYSGGNVSVDNFINITGTKRLKFNRSNLPYSYTKEILSAFQVNVPDFQQKYLALISYIKSNYGNVFP